LKNISNAEGDIEKHQENITRKFRKTLGMHNKEAMHSKKVTLSFFLKKILTKEM
jgi:hypothetical protein